MPEPIINGVDVSKCKYYYKDSCIAESFHDCSRITNCYYKQLKRKEKEIEKLIAELTIIKDCATTEMDEIVTRADYHGFLALKAISEKVNQVLKLNEVENER